MAPMFGQFLELLTYLTHLLGASLWIGGLFFYLAVLRPTLRNIPPTEARKFMELAGVRFRAWGLMLLGALLLTGIILTNSTLQAADDRAVFFASAYGRVLGFKVAVSLLTILLSSWIAFGPVPGMVSALEARDEDRARACGRKVLYFGAFILFLSFLSALCVALLRLSA